MQVFLEKLVYFLPLLFGIGFVAPLTAEIVRAWSLPLPTGFAPLAAGLLLGVVWGGIATWKRRWL
ncbi:MAG: hypothetical protein ABL973_13160 [Micropepsaceae bacterium]